MKNPKIPLTNALGCGIMYTERGRNPLKEREIKKMIIAIIATMLIPVFAVAVCILPIYINEEIEMRKRQVKK